MKKQFHVYIMTNRRDGRLYVGVTSNLLRRIQQHKEKRVPGFTAMYNLDKLAFYEPVPDAEQAIALEKQIKGWVRSKKVALIESLNPEWDDLARGWWVVGQFELLEVGGVLAFPT